MSKKGKAANCEDCMNYEYDEEYECYTVIHVHRI